MHSRGHQDFIYQKLLVSTKPNMSIKKNLKDKLIVYNGLSANSRLTPLGIATSDAKKSPPKANTPKMSPIPKVCLQKLQERAKSVNAFLGRRHFEVERQKIRTFEILEGKHCGPETINLEDNKVAISNEPNRPKTSMPTSFIRYAKDEKYRPHTSYGENCSQRLMQGYRASIHINRNQPSHFSVTEMLEQYKDRLKVSEKTNEEPYNKPEIINNNESELSTGSDDRSCDTLQKMKCKNMNLPNITERKLESESGPYDQLITGDFNALKLATKLEPHDESNDQVASDNISSIALSDHNDCNERPSDSCGLDSSRKEHSQERSQKHPAKFMLNRRKLDLNRKLDYEPFLFNRTPQERQRQQRKYRRSRCVLRPLLLNDDSDLLTDSKYHSNSFWACLAPRDYLQKSGVCIENQPWDPTKQRADNVGTLTSYITHKSRVTRDSERTIASNQ